MAVTYEIPEFPLTSTEYDHNNPTRQTEELSAYIHYIINGLAELKAKIYVETETPASMQAACNDYASNMRSWMSGVVEQVGAYLAADVGSRSPLVIPLAPALPAAMASAVMLPPALLLKTAVDTVATIIHTSNEERALARQYDLNRVLDAALNEDSFWGGRRSYLKDIRDILQEAVNADDDDSIGIVKGLKRMLDKADKETILKVLTHIVLDRGNAIEDVETYFP